jgi:DNA-binding protein HU-beta
MNKAQLAVEVAGKLGVSKKEGEKAVDAVFDAIIEALEGGEGQVDITKVIRFFVKEQKGGERRNPSTGETITVKDKKVVKVKLLKRLKEAQV